METIHRTNFHAIGVFTTDTVFSDNECHVISLLTINLIEFYMKNDHLAICEHFYSIQGEGPSVGTPAVFLRLAGCNLACNGFSYQDPETGQHLGCDSKHVWQKGQLTAFDSIFSHWEDNGWLAALGNGAHLVLTGGEPLMQQPALWAFIQALDQRVSQVYLEIETNATQTLMPEMIERLNQINASPKLRNSGETRDKAYLLDRLQQYANCPQTIFKFVIQHPNDIEEVIKDFLTPLKMARDRIYLMPEGGTQAVIIERSQWLVEACKAHGLRYSPRLHILLWGEVVGI